MIGSQYDKALMNLLTKEFEYQLERRIETEVDFLEACNDYYNLNKVKTWPVSIK